MAIGFNLLNTLHYPKSSGVGENYTTSQGSRRVEKAGIGIGKGTHGPAHFLDHTALGISQPF